MMQGLLKRIIVWGLLSLSGYTATAQTQHPRCPQSGKGYGIAGAAASLTGCPFSATIESESTQTLADGTHIESKFKALVYRDSAGRIRYEMYPPTDPAKDFPEAPNMIHIFDPVAGFWYILTPEPAVASRHRLDDPATSLEQDKKSQHSSPPVSASVHTPNPEPAVEQLGSQLMEGLSVTGRKITTTILAGAEGNDRVLTLMTEIWESSVMGVTLLKKSSDPRSGDLVRRMTNLRETEPDAALFQVPPDYMIRER
jgi:hypothetical protein